jgi:hypothetical protein
MYIVAGLILFGIVYSYIKYKEVKQFGIDLEKELNEQIDFSNHRVDL